VATRSEASKKGSTRRGSCSDHDTVVAPLVDRVVIWIFFTMATVVLALCVGWGGAFVFIITLMAVFVQAMAAPPLSLVLLSHSFSGGHPDVSFILVSALFSRSRCFSAARWSTVFATSTRRLSILSAPATSVTGTGCRKRSQSMSPYGTCWNGWGRGVRSQGGPAGGDGARMVRFGARKPRQRQPFP
jgi:hypothetical protein